MKKFFILTYHDESFKITGNETVVRNVLANSQDFKAFVVEAEEYVVDTQVYYILFDPKTRRYFEIYTNDRVPSFTLDRKTACHWKEYSNAILNAERIKKNYGVSLVLQEVRIEAELVTVNNT